MYFFCLVATAKQNNIIIILCQTESIMLYNPRKHCRKSPPRLVVVMWQYTQGVVIRPLDLLVHSEDPVTGPTGHIHDIGVRAGGVGTAATPTAPGIGVPHPDRVTR